MGGSPNFPCGVSQDPWGVSGGSLGVRLVTLPFLNGFRRGWARFNSVSTLGVFSGVWSFGDPWGVSGGSLGVRLVTLPFLNGFRRGWCGLNRVSTLGVFSEV